MNYDAILHKLGSEELTLSPQMQSVMQRVRTAGLHKVAASLYEVPDVTLKVAVAHLGTSLVHHKMRHQKIASGLESLAYLNGEKTAGPISDLLGKAKTIFGTARPAQMASQGAGLSKGIAGLESMGKAAPWTGGLAAEAPAVSKLRMSGARPTETTGISQMPVPGKGTAAPAQAPTISQTVPRQFGGAISQNNPGMFSSFENMPTPGFNPKKTVVGEQIAELPAIRRLPTA